MSVARDEIFGPVLSVMHVDTLDQAIALVNSDPRGNGTSIFTENGAAVREYSRRIEVGMVGVNIGVAASPAYFPFSGWKDSSLAICTSMDGTRSNSSPEKNRNVALLLCRRNGKVFRRARRQALVGPT